VLHAAVPRILKDNEGIPIVAHFLHGCRYFVLKITCHELSSSEVVTKYYTEDMRKFVQWHKMVQFHPQFVLNNMENSFKGISLLLST
jgi:hypothetical protein